MKKTITINLNNIVFNIDDDAYELLQSYLSEVGHHFKSESEKADIMNDIESRIAELFLEKMDKQKNVITIEDVESIISIMGRPEQFAETSEENADSVFSETKKKRQKRFYRDVENKLLGGVASGIAAYLNVDVTLIRISLVLLVFLTSFSIIPIYFLLWLIIPAATTTAQQLEMRGEDVNIETIKNKMVDAKEYLESDKFKQSTTEIGTRIWEVFRVLFKVIFTFIGAIISIVGVIVLAALIFGLIVFLLEPSAVVNINPELFNMMGGVTPDKLILLIISLLLIIGCPIFALIYWSINIVSKKNERKSNSGLWITLILWLAGVFMFISTGTDTLKKIDRRNLFELNWFDDFEDKTNLNYISETREIEPFNSIRVSGAIEVELSQKSKQSVTVNTLKEYLPNIQTDVTDGLLTIYSTDNLIRPSIKVKIDVDSLQLIHGSGATKINFLNSFNVENLNIELAGASKSDILLNSAQKLDINLKGASKLEITGRAEMAEIELDGASKLDSKELHTKYLTIETSGTSKADVYASETFKVHATGVSKISCYGNPTKKVEKNDINSIIKYK